MLTVPLICRTSLNHNVKKLPLGKPSKVTINKGFGSLKDLSFVMDDTSLAHDIDAYEELSNQYYSYIPHSFDRNHPPVIRTLEMSKPEIELRESSSDLENVDESLEKAKETASQIHHLDCRFQGPSMEEMQANSPSSSEFSEIKQYLHKICGSTQNCTIASVVLVSSSQHSANHQPSASCILQRRSLSFPSFAALFAPLGA